MVFRKSKIENMLSRGFFGFIHNINRPLHQKIPKLKDYI